MKNRTDDSRSCRDGTKSLITIELHSKSRLMSECVADGGHTNTHTHTHKHKEDIKRKEKSCEARGPMAVSNSRSPSFRFKSTSSNVKVLTVGSRGAQNAMLSCIIRLPSVVTHFLFAFFNANKIIIIRNNRTKNYSTGKKDGRQLWLSFSYFIFMIIPPPNLI